MLLIWTAGFQTLSEVCLNKAKLGAKLLLRTFKINISKDKLKGVWWEWGDIDYDK